MSHVQETDSAEPSASHSSSSSANEQPIHTVVVTDERRLSTTQKLTTRHSASSSASSSSSALANEEKQDAYTGDVDEDAYTGDVDEDERSSVSSASSTDSLRKPGGSQAGSDVVELAEMKGESGLTITHDDDAASVSSDDVDKASAADAAGMTPKTGVGFAVLATLLVVGSTLAINYVWRAAALEALVDSLDQMAVELHTSTNSIVVDVFLIPQIIAFLGQVSVRVKELNVSATDNAWIESTDRYFLELLTQHNATAIFVGTERGDFTGSFVILDEESPRNGELSIKTSVETFDDQTTCRHQFHATRDADNPQRDASEVYAECGECTAGDTSACYATTQRSWYLAAKARHENQTDDIRGDWSDVYLFADKATFGITFSVPITDENDVFLGAFGIDLTLGFLSTLMETVTIPFEDGVSYIAQDSGNVIASSIGEIDLVDDPATDAVGDARPSTNELIRESASFWRGERRFEGSDTFVFTRELDLAGGFTTSVQRMANTPGIEVFAVSVFPRNQYQSNTNAANNVALGLFLPLSLILALLLARLVYIKSNVPPGEYDSPEETKRKRYTTAITFTIGCIAFVLFGVWLTWSTLAAESSREVIDSLLEQTQGRVSQRSTDFIKHAQQTNTYQRDRLEREGFTFREDVDPQFAEQYFVGLLNAVVDGAENGTRLLHGVYIGLETGVTIGAFQDDANEIEIKAQQLFNESEADFCRTAYLVDDSSRRGAVVDDSEQCDYVVTARPWYQEGKAAALADGGLNGMLWSSPYSFSGSNNVGVTAMQAITDENGEFVGLFAVDLVLGTLSEFLFEIQIGARSSDQENENLSGVLASTDEAASSYTFLMERTSGRFVACSRCAEIEEVDEDIKLVRLANSSEVEAVQQTVQFLDGLASPIEEFVAGLDAPSQVQRQESAPLTFVAPLRNFGLDWVAILIVERSEFYGVLQGNNRLALLTGLFSLLIMMYLLSIAFRALARSPPKPERKRKLYQKAGGQDISRNNAQELVAYVYNCCVAEQKCGVKCDCYENDEAVHTLKVTKGECEHCDSRESDHKDAFRHIKLSKDGYNSLAYFKLREMGHPVVALTHYILIQSVYVVYIHLVILFHVLLMFWKPPSPQRLSEDGVDEWVTQLEGIFLILEIMDLCASLSIIYVLRHFHADDYLDAPGLAVVYVMRVCTTSIVFIDWLLLVAVPFSIEYYLPIRGILLLLQSPRLRDVTTTFFQAVVKARHIFLMYFCLVLVGSTMSLVLFRTVAPDLEVGFGNIMFSLITSFVFITSGENYVDVVQQAEGETGDGRYIVFFFFLTVFGLFFIMAMVAGFFESDFSSAKENQIRRDRLLHRTGIMAAFLTLMDEAPMESQEDGAEKSKHVEFDCNGKEDINAKNVQGYDVTTAAISYKRFRIFVANHCGSTVKKMPDNFRLSAYSFLREVEEISLDRLVADYYKKKSKGFATFDLPGSWDDHLRVLFAKDWWNQMVLGLIFTHVWLLTLYGTVADRTIGTIDTIVSVLVLVQITEVLMRLVVYASDHWNWALYPRLWDPEFKDPEDMEEPPLDAASRLNTPSALNTPSKKPRLFSFNSNSTSKERSVSVASRSPSNLDAVEEDEEETDTARKNTRSRLRLTRSQRAVTSQSTSAAKLSQILKQKKREDDPEFQELHANARLQQFANRGDFLILLITAIVWAGVKISGGHVDLPFPAESAARFVLTVPILRVFTQVGRTRQIIYTLFSVIPTFASLFVLLMTVFYIYGVYGTTFFSGQFVYSINGLPDSNFDTLSRSFVTLFEMFVGNTVDTTYAVVDVVGISSVFYFLTFTIIVVVLFANLFFSLILGTVSELLVDEDDGEEPLEQAISTEHMLELYESFKERGADLPDFEDGETAVKYMLAAVKRDNVFFGGSRPTFYNPPAREDTIQFQR